MSGFENDAGGTSDEARARMAQGLPPEFTPELKPDDAMLDPDDRPLADTIEKQNQQIIDEGKPDDEPVFMGLDPAKDEAEPVTTMADQGVRTGTPNQRAEPEVVNQLATDLADMPYDDEPEGIPIADVDPWNMRLHEIILVQGSIWAITRVPGGWLYGDTFVPFIQKNREGAQ